MESIKLAKKIRIHALRMTSSGKSSHIGAVLSCADILAVLYSKIMKYDAKNPKWLNRDRFILSKGHAGAGIYAVLAESGFFPIELLQQHYKNGSNFSGHVSHKGIPGVEVSTGSLGHGLPIACGMAFSAKMDNMSHNIFVLLSDGECDEGSNWEAFLFSGHHKLNNLIAIIDYNKIQSLDYVKNTLELEPLRLKLEAFGWHVDEIDGHDHEKIFNCLVKLNDNLTNKPKCVIAHTIKGKGVSFMENKVLWHYRSPQDKELKDALDELGADHA